MRLESLRDIPNRKAKEIAERWGNDVVMLLSRYTPQDSGAARNAVLLTKPVTREGTMWVVKIGSMERVGVTPFDPPPDHTISNFLKWYRSDEGPGGKAREEQYLKWLQDEGERAQRRYAYQDQMKVWERQRRTRAAERISGKLKRQSRKVAGEYIESTWRARAWRQKVATYRDIFSIEREVYEQRTFQETKKMPSGEFRTVMARPYEQVSAGRQMIQRIERATARAESWRLRSEAQRKELQRLINRRRRIARWRKKF